MQPVTFYTFKDIHQQVMDKFEHKAYMERKIIYLRVINEDDESDCINKLPAFYKELKTHVAVKSMKTLQAYKNDDHVLLVIDYNIIRNELCANEYTRVKHILDDLPNILPINEKRTKLMKLLIDELDITFDGLSFNVYHGSVADDDNFDIMLGKIIYRHRCHEPIDVYEKYQKPLLLQLDNIIEKMQHGI